MVVVYTLNSSTQESHVFNSNPRKMETGREMSGKREEYKAGGGGGAGTQSIHS